MAHALGPYLLTILLGVSFASRLDNGSTHKSSSSLPNASSSLRVVAKLASFSLGQEVNVRTLAPAQELCYYV